MAARKKARKKARRRSGTKRRKTKKSGASLKVCLTRAQLRRLGIKGLG